MKNNGDIFQTSFLTTSAPSQSPANNMKGTNNNNRATIFFILVIIDFVSQYTKLIARRIRENLVFSDILSPDSEMDVIMKNSPAVIILSGGPRSVNDKLSPSINEALLQVDIPGPKVSYGIIKINKTENTFSPTLTEKQS